MKAYIGVDAESGPTHGLETTPANARRAWPPAYALPRGDEEAVHGDADCQGAAKRRPPDAGGPEEAEGKRRSRVCAKVEHPFPRA